ncbi:MAG: RNase P modulator RnpM [Chordicoccus sp.]
MQTKDSCRKKPQRTCLGCRTVRNKDELIRVVRTPDGQVKIDPDGRMNGRGAYICRNPECLARAVKSKALQRALKTEIPEETFLELTEEIGRG